MAKTDWFRLLGYVTGLVNQELLLKNEYLVAENRILKAHIRGRLLLSDGENGTVGRDRQGAEPSGQRKRSVVSAE
jgi:hypothetical protein